MRILAFAFALPLLVVAALDLPAAAGAQTTIPALPPGTEAWAGSTCGEWTVGLRGSGSTLAVVNSDTGLQFNEVCDMLHPIACCAPVP